MEIKTFSGEKRQWSRKKKLKGEESLISGSERQPLDLFTKSPNMRLLNSKKET